MILNENCNTGEKKSAAMIKKIISLKIFLHQTETCFNKNSLLKILSQFPKQFSAPSTTMRLKFSRNPFSSYITV